MAKTPPRGKSPKKAKPHHIAAYISEDNRRAWSMLQAKTGIFETQKLLLQLMHRAFTEHGIPFKDE